MLVTWFNVDLSDVVKNDVVKKNVYDKLVKKLMPFILANFLKK